MNKVSLLTGIAVVSLMLTTIPQRPHAQTSVRESGEASVKIPKTPPAPVISDQARQTELSARRDRVAERIGPSGVMILFSGEPRIYSYDVDYEYRQENNLYYLTNLKQQNITLVMMPGHTTHREILFIRRRNPALETWTGRMYSPEEVSRISGIREIWDYSEFEPFLASLRNRQPYRPKKENILLSALPANTTSSAPTGYERLLTAANQNQAALYLLIPREEDHREFRREQRFAAQWAQTANNYPLRNAYPIFAELRQRKSPLELRLLQHAIDITSEALGRAMGMAARSSWEYEVEAEVEYIFKKRNANYWGYPSIVGCGPNATTLHYDTSQGPIIQGSLLLMDVGAEYDHYTADITRTFPVNGKFTPAQADIYNAVLAAQEASFRAIRPGAMFQEVHQAAVESIKDSLLRLGLITDRNSDQFRLWFMHGTAHFLGMNVHDVGERGKLEPNWVFTVEPGIYIREDALDYLPKTPENEKFIAAVRPAFEKYKNIGVRIEDDIVVTNDGFRNLTAALPRTISDLERFIEQATRHYQAVNPISRSEGYDLHGFERRRMARREDHTHEH